MTKITKVIILVVGILIPSSLLAQIDGRQTQSDRDIGFLEFLSVDIAPQNAALGSAGVANPSGGFLTNPALLASQQARFNISLSYSPWLRALGIPSIHYGSLQAGFKLSEQHAIGLSYQQFSVLDQIVYGFNPARPFTQFSPRVFYAQKRKQLSWGLSLAYVESGNEQGKENRQKSRGLSLSGGLTHQKQFWGVDWLFAASLNDWGPIHQAPALVSYLQDLNYFLPTTLRIGGHTSIPLTLARFKVYYQAEQLLLPRNLDEVNSGWLAPFVSIGDAPAGQNWREWQTMLGLEWSEINLGQHLDLALRLGWRYESADQGGRNLLTSGFGLNTQHFSLHTAYWHTLTPNHPLQYTFLFGIAYHGSPNLSK